MTAYVRNVAEIPKSKNGYPMGTCVCCNGMEWNNFTDSRSEG